MYFPGSLLFYFIPGIYTIPKFRQCLVYCVKNNVAPLQEEDGAITTAGSVTTCEQLPLAEYQGRSKLSRGPLADQVRVQHSRLRVSFFCSSVRTDR